MRMVPARFRAACHIPVFVARANRGCVDAAPLPEMREGARRATPRRDCPQPQPTLFLRAAMPARLFMELFVVNAALTVFAHLLRPLLMESGACFTAAAAKAGKCSMR